jgi:hypothetical protein
MVLFSAKFDSDFSIYRFSAVAKVNKERRPIVIDIPLSMALEDIKSENYVIEIMMHYEGG